MYVIEFFVCLLKFCRIGCQFTDFACAVISFNFSCKCGCCSVISEGFENFEYFFSFFPLNWCLLNDFRPRCYMNGCAYAVSVFVVVRSAKTVNCNFRISFFVK